MDFQDVNWLDMVLYATLAISALIGLARGIIKEILSIVAWVASLWLAWRFAPLVADQYVEKLINNPQIAYLLAFAILFFIGLFAAGLFNMLIGSFLRASGLSLIDRFLGMIFGGLRAVLIASVMVFVGKMIPELANSQTWANAKLRPTFERIADWGLAQLPVEVQELFTRVSVHAPVYGHARSLVATTQATTTATTAGLAVIRPIPAEDASNAPLQLESSKALHSETRPEITLESQQESASPHAPSNNAPFQLESANSR